VAVGIILRSSGCTTSTVWSASDPTSFQRALTFATPLPGPIVRINPNELHVRDPDWTDVFKVSRRIDKSAWYYAFSDNKDSTFGSTSHEQHRQRRDAMNGHFSPASVARWQPQVDDLVDKTLERILAKKGEVIVVDDVIRCMVTDVVAGFSLQHDFDNLDHPDFGHTLYHFVRAFSKFGMANRHVGGWLIPLIEKVSTEAMKRLPKKKGEQDWDSVGFGRFYAVRRGQLRLYTLNSG